MYQPCSTHSTYHTTTRINTDQKTRTIDRNIYTTKNYFMNTHRAHPLIRPLPTSPNEEDRLGKEDGQGVRRYMSMVINTSHMVNTSDQSTHTSNATRPTTNQSHCLSTQKSHPHPKEKSVPSQSPQCGIKKVCLEEAGSRRRVHTCSRNSGH